MRVYLSGPMSGLPEFNFPAFIEAADLLREAGYEVDSPAEADLADGFDPNGDEVFDLRAALERDIEAVLDADAVVLLPGWESSPGSVIEVVAASSVGLPVVPLATALRISVTSVTLAA